MYAHQIEILVKASYYKLALIHHPDRVYATQKLTAQKKFNDLHHAYSILSNHETKKAYDVGDLHAINAAKATTAAKWSHYIKPINDIDIENQRISYQGSAKEEHDIRREIVIGNSSITHLLNVIPFMRVEHEERIIEVVKRAYPKMCIKNLRKK